MHPMAADDFGLFEKDSDIGADTAAPASDKARDEAGRFAKTDQALQQEAPAETPPPASETDDKPSSRMVPLSELLSEREKRKTTEAKVREETAKQYEDRIARLEQNLQRSVPQTQTQQPQQRQVPDPIVDPEGYANYVQQVAVDRVVIPQLNQSEAKARKTHGDSIVNAAFQAARQSGADQYFTRAAYSGQTGDAWGDMVSWYQKQQVVSRMGDDPAAYEKQIEDRVRAKVMEELKRGSPPQKFPGSLADATPSGKQTAVLTDEAVAKDIFGSDRNRRQF